MTLRYPSEVRDEAPSFEDIPELKLPKEMLDLASHIVNTKSGHFGPSQFEDPYENALVDLLKKKEAGEKIEPAKEGPAPRVVNLMDASVDAEKRRGRHPASRLVGLLKRKQTKSDSPFRACREVMTPVELDSSALTSSVAFTGRLACMTRAEAFEVVAQRGGLPSEAVTTRTKLLIVGELGGLCWTMVARASNSLG